MRRRWKLLVRLLEVPVSFTIFFPTTWIEDVVAGTAASMSNPAIK